MDRKKKIILTLVCVMAAVLLLRFAGIHAPSDGKVIFKNENTGVSFEDTLSEEEVVTVKKVLWGKIPWPQALYGYPACGFGRSYAITLDDTIYMMSWDTCGTLCVEEASSDAGPSFYIDISDAQRNVLQEMFDSRGAR